MAKDKQKPRVVGAGLLLLGVLEQDVQQQAGSGKKTQDNGARRLCCCYNNEGCELRKLQLGPERFWDIV